MPEVAKETPPPVEPKPAWLIIGMPTIPRRGETGGVELKKTLLFRTIKSIADQIKGTAWEPHPVAGGGVRVLVMNNRPGDHPYFSAARDYFGHMYHFIDFRENNSPHEDKDLPRAAEFINDGKEEPTPKVRRQTLDVVALLDAVVGNSTYFYFTEDDFEFCENTLMAIQYMIERANRYQGLHSWTGIRCGFGLNGIIMHNSDPVQDLRRFRDYLLRHFNRRPPDHLVVEFYAKESKEARKYFGADRHVMAFRYNVAKHIGGTQSTLREESAWSFPGCFTELIAPQVFPVEAWNPVDCPHDDIWPCNYRNGAVHRSTIVWNSDKEAHVSNNRIIYVNKKEEEQHAADHEADGAAGHADDVPVVHHDEFAKKKHGHKHKHHAPV